MSPEAYARDFQRRYDWDYDPDPNAEDRARIDDMIQTAKTAEDWLAICNLAKHIGDEPPIRTWRPSGWYASRPEWDLGIPIGSGKTEAEAIADLLEQEDD